MRVTLHIGMHKTGTSTLQKTLQGYDDGHSLYAPLDEANHSAALYSMFSASYQSFGVFARQDLSADARAAKRDAYATQLHTILSATTHDQLIFSGEALTRLEPDEVTALRDALLRHADSVQVIAYIRDPIGFCRSALQQQIRGGRTDLNAIERPCYRARFEKYLDVFGAGAVTLRPYAPEQLTGGDVVADFATLCGLDRTRLTQQTANVGLPLEAQKCIYLLNRLHPVAQAGAADRAARRETIRAISHLVRGGGRLPDAAFLRHVDAEDTAWMAARLGQPLIGDISVPALPLDPIFADIAAETRDALAALLMRSGVPEPLPETPEALVAHVHDLCRIGRYRPVPRRIIADR